jgi:DNA-binding transcriptional regulator YhcF (GntR family)
VPTTIKGPLSKEGGLEASRRGDPGATVRIHRGSEVPARRQIALLFEAGIREGGYAEGARLPSVRALGERLGVHRETVAAAYRELVRQGLVKAVPGSGVYVSPREPVLDRALGRRDGALAMRLASLSAAICKRRVLVLCQERALGDVIGRELTSAIRGLEVRCEPPPARPCPGVHFGWLPIRVQIGGDTSTGPGSPIAAVRGRDSGPALRPITLPVGLSAFDLKVLSMQRFPAVVGVLSSSAIVRGIVREAVRGTAGPEVGLVSASPDEGAALRRLRARATVLAWDALTASGVPRLSGRRHILLRLVSRSFVSELHDLLGEPDSKRRRNGEGTDCIRAGAGRRARQIPEGMDRVDGHLVRDGDPGPAVRER